MLQPGAAFPVANVGDLVQRWRPDYFTINGRSGFYLSHNAPDVVPANYIGEPTLIRCMNAGLCTHSTHIHGNHVFGLAQGGSNGAVALETNIIERDVWPMEPLARCDLLLPYETPPDIPAFPMTQEPFPLRYVMHCHTEMSQTAAGGNYPQGMVTHWDLLGQIGRAHV